MLPQARFSTVVHPRGSPETLRDVRGFSVRFQTEQGNWDMVGINIPVFFIRDGMKFPDLIHALKPNPKKHVQVRLPLQPRPPAAYGSCTPLLCTQRRVLHGSWLRKGCICLSAMSLLTKGTEDGRIAGCTGSLLSLPWLIHRP